MNRGNELTEGKIAKTLLVFAFPIFLGSLFQQLYNMADAIIVGNYAGDNALAAVTSTGNIVYMLIGFLTGMYQGMAVVIARYYGANDDNNVKKSITTAAVFGVCSGLLLTVIGVSMAKIIIDLVGTPEEVYQDSVTYLRIFFCGAVFTAIYNTMAGICRSLGDSRRPLYYLIVASIVNIVLDFLFVGYYQMGVSGAAIATVIAQIVSAGFSYYRLRHLGGYSFALRDVRGEFNWSLLRQMVNVGIPSGVQNSVIGFANVVVQSNINTFGTVVMAGNGAYIKLQGLVFLPIESFCMAITTFVSQNLGANKKERVKKGARFGMLFCCITVECMGVLAYIFAPNLIGIFGGGAEAIAVGVMKVRIDSLFYFFMAYAYCVSGILRGSGNSKTPMFIMLGIWCGLRVIYIETVMHFVQDVRLVFWAYPMTWLVSGVLFYINYRKFQLSLSKSLLSEN